MEFLVKKTEAIVDALTRLSTDPLLMTQLFEAVNGAKKGAIRVPPHLVERLGDECLLSWNSKEDASTLDPDVATVIRSIPWKKGEVPKLTVTV
jgi:hypothetical protein